MSVVPQFKVVSIETPPVTDLSYVSGCARRDENPDAIGCFRTLWPPATRYRPPPIAGYFTCLYFTSDGMAAKKRVAKKKPPRTAARKKPRKKRARSVATREAAAREQARVSMARIRAADREVLIPDPVDMATRERCIAEPDFAIKRWFPDRFTRPFVGMHYDMIDALDHCMKYGGDQAVAADRGGGKTEILKAMIVWGFVCGIIRYCIYVGANATKAGAQFKDIKHRFETNTLLLADFPEVCAPVWAVDGSAKKGAKQLFEGERTYIEWSAHQLRFARIPGSLCGGAILEYAGLDQAIRGSNIDGIRPDFVPLDDPETAESAAHEGQVKTRMDRIDGDIAGLSENIARVALVTLQNTWCLAAQLTNPQLKETWHGKRYSLVIDWPANRELWEEYLVVLKEDQVSGDRFHKRATAFYAKRRKAMDAGAKIANPHRGIDVHRPDGKLKVLSTLQWVYNEIGRIGIEKVQAEYNNDPIALPGPETAGLTSQTVQTRIHGGRQGAIPDDADKITLGIDPGKRYAHWVKVAWQMHAAGRVVDYGVIEVPDANRNDTPEQTDYKIMMALCDFREEISGESEIDFALTDSGTFTDAVYEFIRRGGEETKYACAKGWDDKRFRMGKQTHTRRLFHQAWAGHQAHQGLWLYNVNSDYYKQFVHERFLTRTFNADQQLQPGSLSLFAAPGDRKKHVAFSHHMVSEERRDEFIRGKGNRRTWYKISKNNHWLDAMALAACAACCTGVRLIPRADIEAKKRSAVMAKDDTSGRFVNLHGQPFLATERE